MTVLLDTNVVSELLRPSPNPAVEGWVAGRQAADLHFSAVSEAELRYGVALLPAGRRRTAGRPVAPADCQIAAIARSRDLTIATRNVRDFADMEIELVDPWADA